MQYVKLINNNTLQFLKYPIKIDNQYIYTADETTLNSLGFKKFIKESKPEQSYEYKYILKYVETADSIIETYDEVVYTDEEKHDLYEKLCVELIKAIYPYNEEIKIIREYLTYSDDKNKKAAFEQYTALVEECKVKAHKKVYGE